MSDAVVMYDDTVGELIDEINEKLSCIRGQQGNERETLIGSVQEVIKDCKKKLHRMRCEIRGLSEGQRQIYDKKAKAHMSRLDLAAQQLREKEEDMRVPLGAEDDEEVQDNKNEVRDAFGRIGNQQNRALNALAATEQTLATTEGVAQETGEKLVKQGEQLRAIDEELDLLGTDIQRAKRELNAFARRMATDKLILCCLFLLVLGIVVAIILKFVLKKDDDNNDAPVAP
eukprot:TRINITY_DN1604_c0_g2_i2.p1 TRINITY_DN1604_c0_g2~~TRINITY_DN1604_c0_g2_i2.p1  ORF type:complete len:229 (+),score=101.03 TRINITY_DN1604_c0_g2_i2:341-1027(+)